MINARVRVKFAGGREMVGVLKGYDQLLNVVLDETVEYMRDAADATRITETTRGLGLVVCRGPNITCVRRALARLALPGCGGCCAAVPRPRAATPSLLLSTRSAAVCCAPTTAWRQLPIHSRRRRNRGRCAGATRRDRFGRSGFTPFSRTHARGGLQQHTTNQRETPVSANSGAQAWMLF